MTRRPNEVRPTTSPPVHPQTAVSVPGRNRLGDVALSALTFLLVACGTKSELVAHTEAVHGYWTTEARQTQLGTGQERLCLERDGSFRFAFVSEGATIAD